MVLIPDHNKLYADSKDYTKKQKNTLYKNWQQCSLTVSRSMESCQCDLREFEVVFAPNKYVNDVMLF